MEMEQRLHDALMENQTLRSQIRQSGEAIPKDKLKILIQLCHPDKHNGTAIATEITSWLLNERKKS